MPYGEISITCCFTIVLNNSVTSASFVAANVNLRRLINTGYDKRVTNKHWESRFTKTFLFRLLQQNLWLSSCSSAGGRTTSPLSQRPTDLPLMQISTEDVLQWWRSSDSRENLLQAKERERFSVLDRDFLFTWWNFLLNASLCHGSFSTIINLMISNTSYIWVMLGDLYTYWH